MITFIISCINSYYLYKEAVIIQLEERMITFIISCINSYYLYKEAVII